jgi:sugar transferase (PEP-CTERM/EpsH1 system associated)
LNVLYLCHRVPYPPNRGDRITTHTQLCHLREKHEVTCLTFATEPGDAASIAALERMGIRVVADPYRDLTRRLAALPWLLTSTPLTLRCFASPKLGAEARRAAERGVDCVVAYSSCMAQFVEELDAPRVMVFGDLDSEKRRQYADEEGAPMRWVYAREARTLLTYETRIARSFEVSTVASPAEAATFEERTGVKPEVVGNGVDLTKFRPPEAPRDPRLVVFTGIMDYRPNVEACVRFARSALPRILREVPGVKFRIVGARPSKEILALAGGAVEVTGAVPETADHLRQASVAVAPLRLGRGLQNKVLEAMACGTPLVASPNAVAGVSQSAVAGEHYLLADDDDGAAAAVVRLLRDPSEAGHIGVNARRLMERRYAWTPLLADFDRAIELALERRERRKHRTPAAVS